MSKRRRVLITTLLLIFLPLLESMGTGTLWGLNYESPKTMDSVSDVIRVLKLLSVVVGFCVLVKYWRLISQVLRHRVAGILFFSVLYLVAAVQVLLLGLGVFIFGVMASKDDVHYEQSIDEKTYYVYTLDPGPIAKAYHYVYLKCPLSLNRYELKSLGKTGWLGGVSIQRNDDELIVRSTSESLTVAAKVYRLELNDVSCES